MRYLLRLGFAVLLGAVFSVPGTTALSAPGTAEADPPTCFGQPATLVGTSGDDVIVGTAQDDVIVALNGNDVVRSHGGTDLVCGGPGDDRLFGGSSPLVCDDPFLANPPSGTVASANPQRFKLPAQSARVRHTGPL